MLGERLALMKLGATQLTRVTKSYGKYRFFHNEIPHSFGVTYASPNHYYVKRDGRTLILNSSSEVWFVPTAHERIEALGEQFGWTKHYDYSP